MVWGGAGSKSCRAFLGLCDDLLTPERPAYVGACLARVPSCAVPSCGDRPCHGNPWGRQGDTGGSQSSATLCPHTSILAASGTRDGHIE